MKGRILASAPGLQSLRPLRSPRVRRTPGDPGITSTSIKIGGTFPLTGRRRCTRRSRQPRRRISTTPTITAASTAQDRLRDPRRRLRPSKTVSLTQQLVEQDKVFADYGSLAPRRTSRSGTTSTARRCARPARDGRLLLGLLREEVPVDGRLPADYPGEAKIYGKYIVKNCDAKTAF